MTQTRFRVVIGTTEGPVAVLRIGEEEEFLQSVVCLRGTSEALPISAAYDAFVRRPTGVVEEVVGRAAFRVDVDGPIDHGTSWQLGLYIAHLLHARGRLAGRDEPADGIIWATGSLDRDLYVGPVTRVAEKIRRSAALFADLGGPPIQVLVPDATPEEDLAGLPSRIAPVRISELDRYLKPLGLLRRPSLTRLANEADTRWFALLAAMVVAWFVVDYVIGAPSRPDALPVGLEMTESRLPAGATDCRDGGLVATPVAPGTVTTPGACGVVWRLRNRGYTTVHYWMMAAVEGEFRDYASHTRGLRQTSGRLMPGATVDLAIEPPPWFRRPVDIRVLAAASESAGDFIEGIVGRVADDGPGKFDEGRKMLGDLGLTVVVARHRIQPPP